MYICNIYVILLAAYIYTTGNIDGRETEENGSTVYYFSPLNGLYIYIKNVSRAFFLKISKMLKNGAHHSNNGYKTFYNYVIDV